MIVALFIFILRIINLSKYLLMLVNLTEKDEILGRGMSDKIIKNLSQF